MLCKVYCSFMTVFLTSVVGYRASKPINLITLHYFFFLSCFHIFTQQFVLCTRKTVWAVIKLSWKAVLPHFIVSRKHFPLQPQTNGLRMAMRYPIHKILKLWKLAIQKADWRSRMLRREVLGNTHVMVQMQLELEIENLFSYWSTVSYANCYGLDNVVDLLNMFADFAVLCKSWYWFN